MSPAYFEDASSATGMAPLAPVARPHTCAVGAFATGRLEATHPAQIGDSALKQDEASEANGEAKRARKKASIDASHP